MFENPKTLWIEIVVVVLVIAFLLFLIGRHIYRKKNNLPTGECACCQNSKTGNSLLKAYNKKYKKNCNCCK